MRKDIEKGIAIWRLNKIVRAVFREKLFQKLKLDYHIWTSTNFFCSKRLMQKSIKNAKMFLYIELEENR